MAVGISSVMKACNNYFEFARKDGHFRVIDSRLDDDNLLSAAAFIAISGSTFHDGVHDTMNSASDGRDEEFDGTVWLLKPPAPFLDLVARISEYDTQVPATAPTSESFGQYSYSRSTGNAGMVAPWMSKFGSQLCMYWRQFTEVHV